MKVTIICVGKLKEKYWRDAIAEYSKRLSRYMKLDIIELADEKAPETMSPAQEAEVKDKEGQRILKNVKDDAFVVALAVEGKMLSSEELAEKIGCNPAVLRKTFDRYCELVEKGVDEDFGKPAEFLHPIEGPKYAALRMHPCVVVSFGGLETDNAFLIFI